MLSSVAQQFNGLLHLQPHYKNHHELVKVLKFIKITRLTNGWPANASNLNLSQQSKSVQHQLECLWMMATCFYLPFFIHSPATYWIYVRCSLIFYDLILCLHQILPAFFKTFSLFLSVELLSNNPRWILMFM